MNRKTAIIISASSDIGCALSHRWVQRGWSLAGTYRTDSSNLLPLRSAGMSLVPCDLSSPTSVLEACGKLTSVIEKWDILVLCPGTQSPVGPFEDCVFDQWEKSIQVNFINQLRFVHELLPFRNSDNGCKPCVLFFAGGGTNNAVMNYSAYTISKVALIKMCELFDAEINNVGFTIVGPGWVKTKIHEETLKAQERAGANYHKTHMMLAGDDCTPMDEVLDCCDWLVHSDREIIGGRNFSVVFDDWGSAELKQLLIDNRDMYKLRRNGNHLLVKKK